MDGKNFVTGLGPRHKTGAWVPVWGWVAVLLGWHRATRNHQR